MILAHIPWCSSRDITLRAFMMSCSDCALKEDTLRQKFSMALE